MQPNLFVVGLTGGIGSGKSAACDFFAAWGVGVIDADAVAADLLQKGSPLLPKIQNALGSWTVDAQGNYNRAAVRDRIAEDPSVVDTLSALTHDAIRRRIVDDLKKIRAPYAIVAAPLLFEGRFARPNLLDLCHRLLVIDLPVDTQIARAVSRGKQNAEHVDAIVAKQISRADRLDLAHSLGADIVDNGGDRNALGDKLRPLHRRYLQQAAQTEA